MQEKEIIAKYTFDNNEIKVDAFHVGYNMYCQKDQVIISFNINGKNHQIDISLNKNFYRDIREFAKELRRSVSEKVAQELLSQCDDPVRFREQLNTLWRRKCYEI